MEMKRYKVVVIDKSMGTFFEEQTYFIEYYDIKSNYVDIRRTRNSKNRINWRWGRWRRNWTAYGMWLWGFKRW